MLFKAMRQGLRGNHMESGLSMRFGMRLKSFQSSIDKVVGEMSLV